MRPIQTPDRIYAELFQAVQESRLFDDSKTFVDALPTRDPDEILADYRLQRQSPAFDLAAFVNANFILPTGTDRRLHSTDRPPVREHIERVWDVLTREQDQAREHSSLLALPHPYVVPGGRFREIYYWDSYFTMLGLAAAGRFTMLRHMVDNFAWLIDEIGFIPNGNRSYYCTRSQPPCFALMVELLADCEHSRHAGAGDAVYRRYRTQLQREYAFWMADTGHGKAARRTVRIAEARLNRYWDDSELPRQESHAEDIQTAIIGDRPAEVVYREIRAGAESGWDYSSRWFADGQDLDTICAAAVVPVDLNCLMYKLEAVLAVAHGIAGDKTQQAVFEALAEQRRSLVQQMFFDSRERFFTDLLLPDLSPSRRYSLAAAFPLFFGLATDEQAMAVAGSLERDFLKPGGWVTTLAETGQQWDAPNGWAPLQWIVYCGLKQYGHVAQAEEGARRWIDNVLAVYEDSGALVEKYNVETPGIIAGGGEYEVQDGFGWTNAVLLCLMDELGL